MDWTKIFDPISIPKAIKAAAKLLPQADSPKANLFLDICALAIIILCAVFVTKENFPLVNDNIRLAVLVACFINGAWFTFYCAKTHLIVETRNNS